MKPVGEARSLSYSATKGWVHTIEMMGQRETRVAMTAATTGAETCSGCGYAKSAVTCAHPSPVTP